MPNYIFCEWLTGIGVLPGLESYTSDDSDNSSSSESEGCQQTDWIGRKVACKDGKHGNGCWINVFYIPPLKIQKWITSKNMNFDGLLERHSD